jgi:hypothetical protein
MHGDALYLRLDKLNCQKGLIILSAYRQYDLLTYYGASHLIPKNNFFLRVASRLLSKYSNRELRRLIDRLRPVNATDWHDPDFL